MSIDFSINGLYIQSSSINDEFLYWDCKLGKLLKDGILFLKDENW